MKTIGIDIGTTTVGIVVMGENELVESETIANGSFIESEPWARVQDAEILVGKAIGLLEKMLAKYSDVTAIGLTGQMHGIVYLDREGMAVSPLYIWQDGRGDLPEFDGQSAVSMIRAQCGIPAATGYGLVTHLYNLKKGLVPQSAVKVCTIADYLGMRLTGRREPLMHMSNAASLGFFDSASFSFRLDALEKMGIDTAILPEITADVAILGRYRDIPVTVSLGDNQASFLGAVGMNENVWQINVGTGGQICVLSDVCFETEGIEARPYIGHRYILTGAILCAGRAYAILEHFFRGFARAAGMGEEEQYAALGALAAQGSEDADGLEVVTTFMGTRTDPSIRGSVMNISENNFTAANLTRAWLSGMAQEFCALSQPIQQGAGIRVEKIVASGNGVRRNPVLQEILSKRFGAELTLGKYREEAAAGAALSTAYRVG